VATADFSQPEENFVSGDDANGISKRPDRKEEDNEIVVDGRSKKPTGLDAIKENVKELHEVMAYMDYSFERAFTIQEKEYMLAYKVSSIKYHHSDQLIHHHHRLRLILICLFFRR